MQPSSFLSSVVIATTLLFAGCASAPTAEMIASAEIGPAPEMDAAKAVGETAIKDRLKDPDSATFRWGTTITRSWYSVVFEKPVIAWCLPVAVNAKNSFGGYVGAQAWSLYFRDGMLVAIGTSQHTQFAEELTPPVPVGVAPR